MSFLLDTCVVAEMWKENAAPAVRQFISRCREDELWISVITVGEIEKGIVRLPAGKRRMILVGLLETLIRTHRKRVLSVDLETARLWGELTARAGKSGIAIPAADGLIAATARQHDLTVATHNARDFRHAGVPVINPWQPSE